MDRALLIRLPMIPTVVMVQYCSHLLSSLQTYNSAQSHIRNNNAPRDAYELEKYYKALGSGDSIYGREYRAVCSHSRRASKLIYV